MKGWIALDIDGTLTSEIFSIPEPVLNRLKTLSQQGWGLILLTGRPFSFGYPLLKSFEAPYFFGVQNGSAVLEMPSRRLFSSHSLKPTTIALLEEAYKGEKEDFLIYSGYEKGDFCTYRPAHFSPELLHYFERMKPLSAAPWHPVKEFMFAPEERFPLMKCLGSYEHMARIAQLLKPFSKLSVTLIRDPMLEGLYLNLVTHCKATKGEVLQAILDKQGVEGPVIAAGDDRNDISMLLAADVRIVMETAPQEVLDIAHIVAPAASKMGILDALDEVIN
jgi:hydroxymethylpyrimidine pyrophosphatase-like HAD family hydrolase